MADITKFNGYDLKDKQLREDILETKMYLGYTDENVIGLLADFENNTFTRLGGAVGKSAGADFNVYNMYGNRKVCAVQDDGTISKWWGEDGYVEDGSIGQIMVRQPKFYYKVVPLKLQKIEPEDETQTDVKGYHGLKMAYYISDKPLPGFKLHPAFINAEGEEVDCYYIGSYEASLWDASENEYRKYDTWDVTDNGDNTYTINAFDAYPADAQNDKLCSIAGVKPVSGEFSEISYRNVYSQLAKNRNDDWNIINIKIMSAEQLLYIIEFAQFNSQNVLSRGVVDFTSRSNAHNRGVFTGSTSFIGNMSGAAESTTRFEDNSTVYETDNRNGYKSVRYRGVENLFGNMWTIIAGINIWGNGKMYGGEAYICDDFNYAESKHDDNYEGVGFTLPLSGYIKYFGYSEDADYVFLPSKSGNGATSTLPIGDYVYVTGKLNAYRLCMVGGNYTSVLTAGLFYWDLRTGVITYSSMSSRLIKV